MTELTSLIDFLDPPEQRSIRFAHLHGRNLKQREIDRFADLGVNALALASPWPMLADRVVFGGKSFHFARDTGEHGEMAFTIGVLNYNGFMDIVAWHPQTGRQAIWLGNGFALGECQLNDPIPSDGLKIHRCPMGWLRAGCRGIVIMREDFARQLLGHVPLLVAEDVAHLRELQALFPDEHAGPQIQLRTPAYPVLQTCEEMSS